MTENQPELGGTVDTPAQDSPPIEFATEDPTNGELPPTEFPQDDVPDPSQDPEDLGEDDEDGSADTAPVDEVTD